MRGSLIATLIALSAGSLGYFAGWNRQQPASEVVVYQEVAVPAVADRVEIPPPLCPEPAAVAEAAPAPAAKTFSKLRRLRYAKLSQAPKGETSRFHRFRQNLKAYDQADRLVGQAISAAEKGNQKLALFSLKRALLKNPRHATAHLLRGVLAQLDGDVAVARTEYSAYLETEPVGTFSAEVRAILDSGLRGPPAKVASR